MVVSWFKKEEGPKGAGLDPATGKIANWFHGTHRSNLLHLFAVFLYCVVKCHGCIWMLRSNL